VDPEVAQTGEPYAYTEDDPVNAVDPLGLLGCSTLGFLGLSSACHKAVKNVKQNAHEALYVADTIRHTTAHIADNSVTEVKSHWRGELQIAGAVASTIAIVATGGAALAGEGSVAAAFLDTASTGASITAGVADAPGCFGDRGVSQLTSCIGTVTGGVTGSLGVFSRLGTFAPSAADLLAQYKYLSTAVLGSWAGVGDWINAVNTSNAGKP
jgi:hypothetical protein